VAAKSSQLTTGETEKGQFLGVNRSNLAGEGVVRKISSLRRVAGMPNLCNERDQFAVNIGNGQCCSGLASESASSLPGSLA